MYMKLFCIVLLCMSLSSASDDPKIYQKHILLRNDKAFREHLELFYKSGPINQRACNGTYRISPEIGAVEKELYFNSSQKCTYTIEAPSEGQRVVVLNVVYDIASTEDFSNLPETSLYDPNLQYDIYDGTEKIESKRLYKLGDQSLDNAVTSGRYLTINLNFEKSDKYVGQSIGTRFGYL